MTSLSRFHNHTVFGDDAAAASTRSGENCKKGSLTNGNFTGRFLQIRIHPLSIRLQDFLTDDTLNNGAIYWDDVSLTATPAAVPIPAAVWLFGSGLAGLVGVARRRKH